MQYEDYLLSEEKGAAVGRYLCVVFNPFLRTSADGDDQCIGQAERPGYAIKLLLFFKNIFDLICSGLTSRITGLFIGFSLLNGFLFILVFIPF